MPHKYAELNGNLSWRKVFCRVIVVTAKRTRLKSQLLLPSYVYSVRQVPIGVWHLPRGATSIGKNSFCNFCLAHIGQKWQYRANCCYYFSFCFFFFHFLLYFIPFGWLLCNARIYVHAMCSTHHHHTTSQCYN